VPLKAGVTVKGQETKAVIKMRVFLALVLLLAVAATGCDSGGDDPVVMFGPSPDIRISTNPDVIGPAESTLVTVQVLNNASPAVGVDVLLVGSGGVFVPVGTTLPDAIADGIVRVELTTDEVGVVNMAFHTATSVGPNTSGLAKITATALGASKTVELRLIITEEVPTTPTTGGEGTTTPTT